MRKKKEEKDILLLLVGECESRITTSNSDCHIPIQTNSRAGAREKCKGKQKFIQRCFVNNEATKLAHRGRGKQCLKKKFQLVNLPG